MEGNYFDVRYIFIDLSKQLSFIKLSKTTFCSISQILCKTTIFSLYFQKLVNFQPFTISLNLIFTGILTPFA